MITISQKYNDLAKAKNLSSLRFSVNDLEKSLRLWRHYQTDYVRKLWAEYNAYTNEIKIRTT